MFFFFPYVLFLYLCLLVVVQSCVEWISVKKIREYLTSSKVKPKSKFGGGEEQSWSKEPKAGPKWGFCHFLKFGLLVFLEIVCNDSLQQCLTSSSGKTYKKEKFGGPKLGFLPFSRV